MPDGKIFYQLALSPRAPQRFPRSQGLTGLEN